MVKDLQLHIQQKDLFSENEPVVIALSGGVDSMVLFYVLYSLNPNIIIAHVNHNKRKASFNEYDEIKDLALNKNVHFEGITLGDMEGNFHDESRIKRFEFFKEVALKHKAKKVFLAHHADDQLETILMRITRGSSFTGYAGIKDKRMYDGIAFLRPFLDIEKEDILEYAKFNNISYYQDSSNDEDDYTRNRFRHHIVPALKKENENINSKILQYSDYLSSADDFIIQKRDEFLEINLSKEGVNLTAFNLQHNIIKIKVLKYIINKESNNTVEVSYQQYQDMIELLGNETPNISYALKGDFSLIKVYNHFHIGKDIQKEAVKLEINDIGMYSIPHRGKYIFSNKKMDITYTDYFELCYNESVFPLYLRSREDGDKMSLKVGTKKVKDIFIDQKVPMIKRDNLILLSNKEKVLWIPNIKKSHQQDNQTNKLYIYEVN